MNPPPSCPGPKAITSTGFVSPCGRSRLYPTGIHRQQPLWTSGASYASSNTTSALRRVRSTSATPELQSRSHRVIQNLSLVPRVFQTIPARLDAKYFINDKDPLTDADDY